MNLFNSANKLSVVVEAKPSWSSWHQTVLQLELDMSHDFKLGPALKPWLYFCSVLILSNKNVLCNLIGCLVFIVYL